jgi:5'-3' exonuclease
MYHHWNKPVVVFDASPLLWIHGYRDDWEDSIHDHLRSVLSNCHTTFYIGILDGKGNFRKDISTKKDYKGNRKQDKPPYFYKVRDLLIEKYNFIIVNGIEADDLLGIVNNALTKPSVRISVDGKMKKIESLSTLCYIASIDKDLLSINAYHYDLKKHTYWQVKDEWSYIKLSDNRKKIKGQGFKFFYAQILMGDAVDNIPGLPKCGPVKTEKILRDCITREDCEKAVLEAYIEWYDDKGVEEMEEQKSLVKILTHHYDVPRIEIQDFDNRGPRFKNLTLF